MLISNMDISRLIVHAKQIEKQNIKQVCRELKKVRTDDGNSSKTKFEVQYKPRFKSRFSKKGPYNAPRVDKSKVSTPKTQEGKSGISYVDKPFCAKCDTRHEVKFLVRMGSCCGCG